LERSVLDQDLAKLVKNSKIEDVDLAKASPFLLREIVRNNKILFEEDGAYAKFYLRATQAYFEARPFFEFQLQKYAKKIQQLKKLYAK